MEDYIIHKSHVIVISTSFAEVKHNAYGNLKKKKNQHFEIVFENFYLEFIIQYLHPPCIFSPFFLKDPFHDRAVSGKVDGS